MRELQSIRALVSVHAEQAAAEKGEVSPSALLRDFRERLATMQIEMNVQDGVFADADRAIESLLVAFMDTVNALPSVAEKIERQGTATQRQSLSGLQIHDLLRQRALYNLQLQRESAATTAAAGAAAAARHPKRPLKEHNEVPKIPHRSRKVMENIKPERILDVRGASKQRQYLFKCTDVEEPIWVTRRQANEEMQRQISVYLAASRNERRRMRKASKRQGTKQPDELFIVQEIVTHRYRAGKKQYFVKWEGYDTDENTWESAGKLRQEVPEVVNEYERMAARRAPVALDDGEEDDDEEEEEEEDNDDVHEDDDEYNDEDGDEDDDDEEDGDEEDDDGDDEAVRRLRGPSKHRRLDRSLRGNTTDPKSPGESSSLDSDDSRGDKNSNLKLRFRFMNSSTSNSAAPRVELVNRTNTS
ncbi:hypothetical protein PINS_up014563 [Pythium insidiosum]|nr:hypothetical protein PINS_up014563 [Pythium insidiosum]